MGKKIYFVTEGIVDDKAIHSEKFNQIVNPDTGELIFDDVFQITDCKMFEKYKQKEEFLEAVLDIAEPYFADFGEIISKITLIAIDEKTDVFLWGVSMENFVDDSFQYATLDFKAGGYTLKFKDGDAPVKIINKVTDESYVQWIEKFVRDVIDHAEIECNEVIIEDIEHSKRIILAVDGEEYVVRTWNFRPAKKDKGGEVCAEVVEYTLYKMIMESNGNGHGEIIDEGLLRIEWNN